MTVAGLALRPFSGSGDYPAMVEIINAARSADGIESTYRWYLEQQPGQLRGARSSLVG